MEPGELLEDSWFFGNLLRSKPRMSRSFSDPCTTYSSSFNQDEISSEKSYEETYASIKKRDELTRPKLIRAQSSLERQDQNMAAKASGSRRGKSSNRKSAPSSSSKSLARAPSLPASLDTDEFEDEEIEFSMGKLIRQASLNYSERSLPPRQHAAKGVTPRPSISSRQKSRRESIKPEGPINQLKAQKAIAHLEYDELQGFRDLGLNFDSPNVININPGLQEKKRIEQNEEKTSTTARRPPYLSEKLGAAPPVPRRAAAAGKKSTEDMKAQIKFWARAVASNVRQEC